MDRRLVTAAAVRTPSGIQGEAVLIADGRVEAIGGSEEFDPSIPVEHVPGVIVPGLRDAHLHPGTYTAALFRPSLKAARSIADVAERISAAAAATTGDSAVTALRLDDESLEEQRLPTREDLDPVLPDRPVLIHRYCGHVAVANTAALELAGIGPATADPIGGSLDRDDSGNPNGILRETAVTIVAKSIADRFGSAITPSQLVTATHALAATGLTSIGAIIGCGDSTWAELGDEVEVLVAAAPDIPIKFNVLVIAHTPDQLESSAERLASAPGHVRFLGLKAFSDGSLGGHTAAMRAPFADRPTETGTVRLDHDWAVAMTRHSAQIAERVAIHAIGDRANGLVLDVFEAAVASGVPAEKLRVEHASVLGPGEIDRFADGGFTASVQPAFIASETQWLVKRVGAQRLRGTYPFRSLADRGVPLAGGSDCPVEPPDPLLGIATARDRCGIVPEEGLGPEEALALFTTGAAAAMAEPEPLLPGGPADFTVLDVDPVTATPDDLRRASVIATYVDGRAVPLSPDLPAWPG